MRKLIYLVVLIGLVFLPVSTRAVTATGTNTDYQTAKNAWLTAKKNLEDLRARNQDMTIAKKEALTKAQKMASASVGRAIKRLKMVIARVDKMASLTASRKEALAADLTTQITALKAAQLKIEAATTKEELVAAVKETRSQTTSTRDLVKKIVEEIRASHIDKTLEKLGSIVAKIEGLISGLKDKGQNVAAFEAKLQEAKAQITAAQTANKTNDYKQARKLAEEARAILVKLVGELKAAGAKLGGNNE